MEKINSNIMASFQMLGSRVVSLNVKNDSLSSNIIALGKKDLEISHELVSAELQEGMLIGIIRLNVSVRIKQDKTRYTLKLCIEGGFSAPQEMGNDNFKRMMSLNGIASLYSIARAHICTISSQSFADGSIMLPMIDVTKYSKNLDHQEKEP